MTKAIISNILPGVKKNTPSEKTVFATAFATFARLDVSSISEKRPLPTAKKHKKM